MDSAKKKKKKKKKKKAKNLMDMFDEIKDSLDKEKEHLKEMLASGAIEDYNHYKQIVGTISGIEWSKNNLITIIKKRIEDE